MADEKHIWDQHLDDEFLDDDDWGVTNWEDKPARQPTTEAPAYEVSSVDEDFDSPISRVEPIEAPVRNSRRRTDSTDSQPQLAARRKLTVAAASVLLLVGLVALLRGSSGSVEAQKGVRLANSQVSAGVAASFDRLQQVVALDRFAAQNRPVYCGGGSKKQVAITFDDGPDTLTDKFTDLLAKQRVKATFFRIGKKIAGNERSLRRQQELGFAAGSHTHTHAQLVKLGLEQQRDEIVLGEQLSMAGIKRPTEMFRPPYGSHNDGTDDLIKDAGMVNVLWNVDVQDAIGNPTSSSVYKKAVAGLKPGAIILLHETKQHTLDALPKLIAAIKRKGYTTVTVPELLATDPPSDDQLAKGYFGCRNLGKSAKATQQ